MHATSFEQLREIFEEKIPFNKWLGFKLLHAEVGEVRACLDFRPELIGNYLLGILHGGIIASVLDVIGGAAVLSAFVEKGPLVGLGTVDLRVDYLRPASGSRFFGSGTLMRPGRILASTRMEFYDEKDTLCAIGTAIYRMSREDKLEKVNL